MLKRILIGLALVALGTPALAGKVGPRFQVNTYKTDDQITSAVTPSSNGGFVVAWTSEKQDGFGLGIYAQIYNSSGTRVGLEIPVNTRKTGDQLNPSIANLGNGGFIVAWDSPTNDIYAQRFDAAGKPKGAEFRVNTRRHGEIRYSSVTGLKDGAFVVVWFSSDFATTLIGQRYKASGVRDGVEFNIATLSEEGMNIRPVVAGLEGGGFVVSWHTRNNPRTSTIYARRFSSAGKTVGAEIKVAVLVDNFATLAGPGIAALKGGGFVIIWDDLRSAVSHAGTFGQRYSETGALVGAKFRANTTPRSADSAISALANGGFVVTFTAPDAHFRGHVLGQRYKPGGAPFGPEFSVGTPLEATSSRGDSAVAGLSLGGLVVTWTEEEAKFFPDGKGVFGQRFNP